jgi:hypothetical protein
LLVTLVACAERVVESAPAEQPLFLIGDTPTSHLIGETPTFSYSPADGAFTVGLAVNRGLLEASEAGHASFAVQVSLAISGPDGTGLVVVSGCPLADVKPLADPRPDPFVAFNLGVPWDGKDSDGNAMTGKVTVNYTVGVLNLIPIPIPIGDGIAIGSGPVTGFFDVFLAQAVQ